MAHILHPAIRAGDKVIDLPDPRGGWSVVVARPGEIGGGILNGRQGAALSDETPNGSVLVDVAPMPVYEGGRGVWMRVGSRRQQEDPAK